MPSIDTAPATRMPFQHGPASKSPLTQKPEKPEASDRLSGASAPDTRATPDAARAKGVLRLLAEDHFSGVAGIRLRMNFHAELQDIDAAAETGSTITAAETLRADMAAALAEKSDELDGSLVEPVNALFSQFDQAVGGSLGDEAAAGPDIQSAVADALTTLREGLANLLESVDAPAPSDAGGIGATEDVPSSVPGNAEENGATTGEAVSPQPIVLGLIEYVDQLTAAFENTVSATSMLTNIEDITPPRGNGVAFEKFVEQYRAQFMSSVDQSGELHQVDEQV